MRDHLSTRPPLDRMTRIFQSISSGQYPNREQLAVDIEVTTKTIQRDIDFLRDRMNLPIAYDRNRKGYYFTEPVSGFPLVDLTEAEIVSVFIAQKALIAHRGTPFEEPLRSAYQKLANSLNGRISVPWADLGNSVSFRTYQSTPIELGIFQTVGIAVRHANVLRFGYKKLGASRHSKREVEPYHLACIQGQWYAIAYDRERKDWRNFVLSRMQHVEALPETFVRNRPFDIDTYLRGSLGIFQGKGMHRVQLEFDAWAAQLIRERVWHPGQRIQELTGERLAFAIELSSLEEIIPWILSWGEHVHVVQPVALKRRLRATVEMMTRNLCD